MSNVSYEEGVQAFQQSQPTASCEYALGSDQGREWLRGWTEGQVAERDISTVENAKNA
jgi:hypothetical protein